MLLIPPPTSEPKKAYYPRLASLRLLGNKKPLPIKAGVSLVSPTFTCPSPLGEARILSTATA